MAYFVVVVVVFVTRTEHLPETSELGFTERQQFNLMSNVPARTFLSRTSSTRLILLFVWGEGVIRIVLCFIDVRSQMKLCHPVTATVFPLFLNFGPRGL